MFKSIYINDSNKFSKIKLNARKLFVERRFSTGNLLFFFFSLNSKTTATAARFFRVLKRDIGVYKECSAGWLEVKRQALEGAIDI